MTPVNETSEVRNGSCPSSMFSLEGRTAIVTGAATGIGEAIAIRLAYAGATVAVVDLNLPGAQKVAAALPNRSFAIEADVARADSVRRAVDQALQHTGQIDILVNNAGIAGPAAFVWEQTDEDWQRNISINLTGVFNFCRAVVPHMRSRGFTKSVGKELATEGICVNAISPAVIQTQILDQLTSDQVAYMTERIPMRRAGRTEEIAYVVHFLASSECSFVTAQCYDASGGRATY